MQFFRQKSVEGLSGFRRICADEANVNEETVTISKVNMSSSGIEKIQNFNPNQVVSASTFSNCSNNIFYIKNGENTIIHSGSGDGKKSDICIKNVEFKNDAQKFQAKIKGRGVLEVYTDSIDSEPLCKIESNSDDWNELSSNLNQENIGVTNLYFVISDGLDFESWQVF